MLPVVIVVLCLTPGRGLIMPMVKPDGSLDVSSLLSHISLLEQTIEGKASTSEISDLKSQLQTALADLKQAQLELKAAQTEITDLRNTQEETKEDLKLNQIKVALLESQLNTANSSIDIPNLKSDISTLKTDVFHLQSQRNASEQAGNTAKGGAQFIRWGRTTCPSDTKVVYKGYTGGSHYSYKSSTATTLCLPEHPIFDVHAPPVKGYESYIFGTEYETAYNGNPFERLENDNIPCVVCESETKRSAIMVPARNQCYPGWTLEYWGYLMGGEIHYASAEYICVDKDPEAVPGGHTNDNQHVLFITASGCGSLPCPPYEDKWQLTCAVCSK